MSALLDRPVVQTCCPQCQQEYFDVVVERSGSGSHPEYGTVYFYEGEGHCHHCGFSEWHQAQSI